MMVDLGQHRNIVAVRFCMPDYEAGDFKLFMDVVSGVELADVIRDDSLRLGPPVEAVSLLLDVVTQLAEAVAHVNR